MIIKQKIIIQGNACVIKEYYIVNINLELIVVRQCLN
jgi:hypothetical protein